MPLKTGSSKSTIEKNIRELVSSAPSSSRKKAIDTIAKKQGISKKEAKIKQAVAISHDKARRSRV